MAKWHLSACEYYPLDENDSSLVALSVCHIANLLLLALENGAAAGSWPLVEVEQPQSG